MTPPTRGTVFLPVARVAYEGALHSLQTDLTTAYRMAEALGHMLPPGTPGLAGLYRPAARRPAGPVGAA